MDLEKKDISRKDFLKISSAIIGAAGLISPFFSSCKKGRNKIKIGYIPITDASSLLIAYANGYFKDEGLDVAEPVLIRSWSSLVEAFLAGKVNVAHFLIPIPIWMRYNRNLDAKIVAWAHINGSALTVRGDSDIKSFADLGGRQIAVPYWYSMHNILLQYGLKKFGLVPVIKPQSAKLKKNEVNLFILPPPEMPLALEAGKIDGYIVAEPFNALGEIKSGARIVRFTGDIWKNHPCCTVVMRESFINEDPVRTQKIVNAIVRAEAWINENPIKTAKILSKEEGRLLPVSEKVLLKVFDNSKLAEYKGVIKHAGWHSDRIGFQPYPYDSATRFIFDQIKTTALEGNKDFLFKLQSSFVEKDLVESKYAKNAIKAISGRYKFPDMDYSAPWERQEIIGV